MAKRVSKADKKKRAIRVTLIVIIVLAILAAAIGLLRKQVTSRVNSENDEAVQTATVSSGSITTTVSGSGNLSDEDIEEIILHSKVEVDEIVVEPGDTVKDGDLLATVNIATVLSAMSDVQTQLDELDDEIGEASDDELDDTITSALSGRVKKIYAGKGDDVSTIMYEKGALALLSLDGYMAVELETDELKTDETVTVTDSDGTKYTGTVESAGGGTAVVLISDKSSKYNDKVTVTDKNGNTIGSGKLYIHEMMKITGIAGTVSSVYISKNQQISAGKTLFALTDTSFSANYTSLLKEREELEEQLQQLIAIYQNGALVASMDGTISAVNTETASNVASAQMAGASDTAFSSSLTTNTSSDSEDALISICPGKQMSVTIQVDETDILSLEKEQKATVSIDALEGESVEGTVTAIDTTATSSDGVTVYTVTVTFDKTEQMLSGMSASISVVIEGVDDALLIPSDALTQTSSTSYVYTSYDEETGELGNMVEVTTGMNNGDYVEITGGLSEGDTVYYFEKEDETFGFGGMNFGGGEMPGGFGGGRGGNSNGGGMPGGFGGGSGGGMPSGFGN